MAAGLLINRGLLVAGFVLGMVLVATTVVTQGLQKKPMAHEIGMVLGISTIFFMLIFRLVSPTERSHLIEYAIVAVFIYEALLERKSQGHHIRVPGLCTIFSTSLAGTIDESIQLLIPNRVFATDDIIFNTLAAVGAVSTCALLGWIRQWYV